MPAGPTFASGPVRPGTFVQVDFQRRPPSSPPPFITALIGRTIADKPASKILVRNQVAAQTVSFDPNTNVTTVTTGDADETIRRDILTTDNTTLVSIGADPITDNEVFQQFSFGFDNDWVETNVTAKGYIEWLADYAVKTVGASIIFMGKAGAGTFIVQMERASADPIFTVAPTPMTVPNGVATFRMTVLVNVYSLSLKGPGATGFGTAVVVTAGGEFTILDNGTGGSGGSIKVKVDVTQLTSGVGMNFPTDTNYDNTVIISTRGPRSGIGTTAATTTEVQALGAEYTVPYRAKKTISDFIPVSFDTVADIENVHGRVVASTGVDYLSVGANPYFNEGGRSVFVVPLKDKDIVGVTDGYDLDEITGSGYVAAVTDALVQLENVVQVSCVIVLSPTEVIGFGNFRPGILNAVLSHVNRMSSVSAAKPRLALLGARAGTTLETTFTAAASAAHSNRILYIAPATATLNVDGVTKIVDGSTIAAAIAGILSSGIDAGEPISGKVLTSFVDVPDPFTAAQKDRIAETFGVTLIDRIEGRATISHFLTTNPDDSLHAEGKVTVIEIDVRRSLKGALDKTLINQRLLGQSTIAQVRSLISQILGQKVAIQVLRAFDIIKVEINTLEPRQIDVELAIMPVFDTNWVYIKAIMEA